MGAGRVPRLRDGAAVSNLLGGLTNVGAFTPREAGTLTRAATLTLCPDQDDKTPPTSI